MKSRKIGNIKKVGTNKYKIRISAGFDDFGKRIVINKTVNATSDTQAEKILMELYAEKDKNIKTSGNPETLKDLYNIFYENHLIHLAPNTQDYYRNLWKHIDNFGKIKIKDLNIKNINKIIAAQNDGKCKNSVFKMLKTIINKSITWGYFKENNPCNFIPTPKYKAKEKNILNDDDIKKIAFALPDEELKYQCIFYFACMLGLRREEILALTWKDIDTKAATVNINKAATLSHNTSAERIIIKETKTDKSKRVLYISPTLLLLLKQYKKEQNIFRIKLGDLYQNNDFVFTQLNGKIMNIHTPTNWWREFRIKNNISDVTFHGLRHSAASLMINNNIDIATVSRTLGHSNITTTLNTYTHLIEDSKKKAIEIVEGYFVAK